MKRLLFLNILLFACLVTIGQIKPRLKEILFDLSIPSSKYNLRKLLHSSNNFSNIYESIDEKYDIINADFKENFRLSFLKTSSENSASFWFNKGTDINFSFSFTLKYLPKNVNDCTNQYNEIINLFKSVSYKSTNEPWIDNNVQRGEWFSAYSSLNKYQRGKAYLIVTMELVNPCEKCTNQNTYYWCSLSFYKQGLD